MRRTRSVIELADLRIDAAGHSVMRADKALHLMRRAFDLHWMSASHHGRLMTQSMILRTLWGPARLEDFRHPQVHIRQLRRKLGDDAATVRYFATEPVIGCRLLD